MIEPKATKTINHIKVNLLPLEVILLKRQGVKLIIINWLSIGVLVFLIFLTSIVLTLRISQRTDLTKAQNSLNYVQDQIGKQNTKEGELLMLKQRVDKIRSINSGDIKQRAVFNLITSLLPYSVLIHDFSVDKSGNTVLSLSSADINLLDGLITDLIDKEKNSDLVDKIRMDGLALGQDSLYRLNLKITVK